MSAQAEERYRYNKLEDKERVRFQQLQKNLMRDYKDDPVLIFIGRLMIACCFSLAVWQFYSDDGYLGFGLIFMATPFYALGAIKDW